jgi:N6-L-threonylcarbamoyladenine synthase
VRGHIAANYIAYPELEPPFLCLCVSGGTSLIVDVRDYTDMEILGSTRDDAAGECFDKIARVMGLGYPGGGPLDRASQGGNDKAFALPKVHIQDAPLDLSFSGLKTAMLNLIHNAQQKGEELPVADLAASFSAAVSEELVPRTVTAARQVGYGKVAVVGGVAANSRIRRDLETACQKEGWSLYLPPLKLCGDNGSMIGSQGYYEYLAGTRAGSDLNGYANRDISLTYGGTR